MSTGRLESRTALVTGGGAGIGRAICRRFAAEGASALVCDTDLAAAEQTARSAREAGGDARAHHLDVSDEAGWTRALDVASTLGRGLAVLVNNAGLPHRRPLAQSSWEQWQSLMAVNAGGTFVGMKHALPALASNGGGSVVNIASAAALTGVPGMVSYSAGKGAIRAMSRVAAMEGAVAGVRVNSVYPTSVRTAMVDSDARDTGVTTETFLQAAAAMSPLGRIAEPDDVADAVLFLAGDESRFITGAELVVDGGATAGIA